ncbi:MAG TPA: hypothetical protein VGS96_08155 [Thermoanaerobaculia bacterium]|nr:hypothetical protein [Thermoanaerobaculia bacterium]
MKWNPALVPVLVLLAASTTAQKVPDPIIDMHLHAIRADANGPPPMAVCAPPENYPPLDPKESWPNTFTAWARNPPCANPVWGPLKDEDRDDAEHRHFEKAEHLCRHQRWTPRSLA